MYQSIYTKETEFQSYLAGKTLYVDEIIFFSMSPCNSNTENTRKGQKMVNNWTV